MEIGFPFELVPRFAFIGRETSFTARSSVNVTSSVWNFDDGTPAVTVPGVNAKHLYGESGEYMVKVILNKAPVGTSPAKNSTKRFSSDPLVIFC